jgi:hypothetical protein
VKIKLISLRLLALLFVGLTLSLAACGGGGGGAAPNATITGTVLGTTVMAVDAATNVVVSSVIADPSTKVFSMQLPIGKNYKCYLLENEGTTFERSYPVYVFNQGQSQNVFSISQANTIDLGFMDTASGAAVPALGLSQMENLGMSPVSFDSTVPSTLNGTFFSPGDMQGAWNMHGIADDGAWFHTTMTIGSNGAVNMGTPVSSDLNFQDTLAARTMSLSMTPGGVMNSPGNTDFNAFMGSSRQMFIATDLFPSAHQMYVAQRVPSGVKFSTTNLQGTWQVQGLMNGSSLFNGWMEGSVTFEADGSIDPNLTKMTRNDGNPFTLNAAEVDGNGTVTMSGSPQLKFHGTMNQNKDRIVATLTDSTTGSSCLLVLQKSTNTSHTNADFGGTWYMHNVAVVSGSGDGRADFGAAHFDTSGNATMERFSTNPAFTTTSSSLLMFSMTINPQGMMGGMNGFPGMTGSAMIGGTMPGTGTAGFGGFMNMDNSLFITNMTNTQGGTTNWDMMILQK